MGIRIALGAQPLQVSMLLLRQGLRPGFGGLLVGVAAALAAGQLIRSFRVSKTNDKETCSFVCSSHSNRPN